MKAFITVTLVSLTLLAGCNGDVSESRNYKLPLNSFTSIPSPVQSLLPPTFENPIKDYTVGLVPPPVDSQPARTHTDHRHHHVQAPVHQHPGHYSSGLITPTRLHPVALRTTAHQYQTHYSTNLPQPQVYQPKTVVHQQNQRHSVHQHHYQPNSIGAGLVLRSSYPSAPASHSLHHPVQHYAPITQAAVHQYSGSARYASVPVRKVQTVAEHVHANVQHSSTAPLAFVPHHQPASGVRIIQTYPSVSYAATAPQHGSTLNLGSTKLDPELVYIISEVLGRHHI